MATLIREAGRLAVLAALVFGAIVLWRELAPGRYELVATTDGMLHRLDTATGELQAVVLGTVNTKVDPARFRYWPVSYSSLSPSYIRALVDQVDAAAAAK